MKTAATSRCALLATPLCALVLAMPALAQQDVFRNDLPETRVTPGEAPPRDTSRSEGVYLDQQQAAGDDLPVQVRQALTALSRNAVTAQQLGNLAASKQAPAPIRDLGDRMVTLNSEINERLDQAAAAQGIRLPQRMPQADQRRFETLADTNQDEFGRGLVAWVSENYPTSIRALQALADQPQFRDLAAAAIPALRDQLRASRQMAQAFRDGDPKQARMPDEGGARQRGQDEQGAGLFEGQPNRITQADEPQHTAETEREGRSPGQLYRHQGVGTDPQSRTQAPPGQRLDPIAAGEPSVVNAGGLMAAMANVEVEMRQWRGREQAGQVRVVPAREAVPGDQLQAIRDSVETNRDRIARLRQAIGADQTLAGALRQSDSSAREVIAMDVLDEGVILYTLEPQQAENPLE